MRRMDDVIVVPTMQIICIVWRSLYIGFDNAINSFHPSSMLSGTMLNGNPYHSALHCFACARVQLVTTRFVARTYDVEINFNYPIKAARIQPHAVHGISYAMMCVMSHCYVCYAICNCVLKVGGGGQNTKKKMRSLLFERNRIIVRRIAKLLCMMGSYDFLLFSIWWGWWAYTSIYIIYYIS